MVGFGNPEAAIMVSPTDHGLSDLLIRSHGWTNLNDAIIASGRISEHQGGRGGSLGVSEYLQNILSEVYNVYKQSWVLGKEQLLLGT
jgi:hypothetical protein